MGWKTPVYDWLKGKLAPDNTVVPPPYKIPEVQPSKPIVTPPAAHPIVVPPSERVAACMKMLAEFEGGKDDDPRDPGGRTAYGVIQREYNKWRREHGLPVQDVWKIAQAEVYAIFKAKYWDAARCDELPLGTDYAVFDYWVNSGEGQVARDAQRVCGLTPDGDYGPKTFEAIKAMPPKIFVPALYARRLRFLQNLGTWDHFGKGWTDRCVRGQRFCMTSIKA